MDGEEVGPRVFGILVDAVQFAELAEFRSGGGVVVVGALVDEPVDEGGLAGGHIS